MTTTNGDVDNMCRKSVRVFACVYLKLILAFDDEYN